MSSANEFKLLLARLDKGSPKKENELIELENKQREQPSTTNRKGSIEQSLLTLFNTGLYSKESVMAAIKSGTSPNTNGNGHATTPQGQAFKATVEKPLAQTSLNTEKPRAYLSGWIKLHRKLSQSEMYRDLNAVQRDVMIQCLLMANHNEAEWEWKGQIHKCKPGQSKTSLEGIRQNCAKGTTIKMVRTALKKLEKWQFLASEGAKQGRIVTIINWSTYQVSFQPEGKEVGMIGATNKKIRIKEKKSGGLVEIPLSLQSESFLESWESFKQHREDIKKPMNFIAEKTMLKKLESFGVESAPAALERAIIGGWPDVVPPKPVRLSQAQMNQAGQGLIL